jgi:hypothetical protein
LDIDDEFRLLQLMREPCVLLFQFGITMNKRIGLLCDVPHDLAEKKVMLRIKEKIIRIYHDHDLVATYEEPKEKHTVVGDPAIYRLLAQDKEQIKRKYGRQKGKATRGLVTSTLFPEVTVRSLEEYERLAGGSWNN